MKFCTECAGPLRVEIPKDDDRARHVCTACGAVHYRNPKVVVGCVPIHEGRVLLCKRGIEPQRGLWTVPAGFLENGETLRDAAIRECYEETLARVELGSLLAIIDAPRVQQVHVFFRARFAAPGFGVGRESLDVRLFGPNEIPWRSLAFLSNEQILRRVFADDTLRSQRRSTCV